MWASVIRIVLVVVVRALVVLVIVVLILIIVTIARIPEVIATVIPAFKAAVLDITIIPYLFPAVTSYLIGKPSVPDKNPRSAEIIGNEPAAIMVQVITAITTDDILRAPYRYGKAKI